MGPDILATSNPTPSERTCHRASHQHPGDEHWCSQHSKTLRQDGPAPHLPNPTHITSAMALSRSCTNLFARTT
eukprot:435849-Rhodomonas_salina.2